MAGLEGASLLKPRERLYVRREPGFSLSQTSWSASVLIVSTTTTTTTTTTTERQAARETKRERKNRPQFRLLSVINQEINKCVTGLCRSQRQWAFCVAYPWPALNIINEELHSEKMKNGSLISPFKGYFPILRHMAFMRLKHGLETCLSVWRQVIKRNHYIAFPVAVSLSIFTLAPSLLFLGFWFHPSFRFSVPSVIYVQDIFPTSKCFSIWQTMSWSLHTMELWSSFILENIGFVHGKA